MKFRMIPLLLAAAMALGGCGKVKERMTDYDSLVKESLGRAYSFTAEFAYDGGTAAAQVTKTGEADVRLDFTAPETLDGLSVSAGGEEILVEYRGMEVDLSAYGLPTQSILTLLREVLTGEKEGKLTTEVGEDTVTASGTIILTTYQIVFDKETMEIRKILIPSVDGEVAVTDFTYLEEEEESASY